MYPVRWTLELSDVALDCGHGKKSKQLLKVVNW